MSDLLTNGVLLAILAGGLLGILGGATPGLSSAGTVALLVPLTYPMGTLPAILFLLAAYTGAQYGGSITATVFNIPGSPESAVMTLEGYALTRQGQGRRALQAATVAGLVGGLVGVAVLVLLAPFVAEEALKFGPPEFAALGVLGATVIASLGGHSMPKSFLAAAFGMLVASIGLDPVSGTRRMTFGLTALTSGLPLIPVLIGLFAVSQGLHLLAPGSRDVVRHDANGNRDDSRFTWRDAWTTLRYVLTAAFVGVFVGIKPGGGATIASYLSYAAAKGVARRADRKLFGRGWLGGLMAPESADKATVGAALIPTLTLGIPASASAAVILGAFRIHNVLPGPTLFATQPTLVRGVFIGLMASNVAVFALGQLVFRGALRVRRFNPRLIGLLVLVIAFLGSYASAGSPTDVMVAAAFGLIGCIMNTAGVPLAPVILGFILGPIIEVNLRQSLLIHDGYLLVFVERPISLVILLLAVVLLLVPFVRYLLRLRPAARRRPNSRRDGEETSSRPSSSAPAEPAEISDAPK